MSNPELFGEEWLKKTERIEEGCGCDIVAGVPLHLRTEFYPVQVLRPPVMPEKTLTPSEIKSSIQKGKF
jgi:hypothetical protein